MPDQELNFSKSAVNRAGKTLLTPESHDHETAKEILDNWRACHITPLNSFQKTLRTRLSKSTDEALISQRLKRTPSILAKLQRNPKMVLSRMQDIGGIRAVVKNINNVRELESQYKRSTTTFSIAAGGKDYISYPKESGYRSVHILFKCRNGFAIELQIRTQIQHAWATAVETMGTFLSHSLKSSEGPEDWLNFFALASSAFAVLEHTPRVPGYDQLTDYETFKKLLEAEKKLGVINKLSGFRVAATHITNDRGAGKYHLVVLDLEEMRVKIRSFEKKHIELANKEYSKIELDIKNGRNYQAVLVASDSINALKKAYPSYFLDAELFNKKIMTIEKRLSKLKP